MKVLAVSAHPDDETLGCGGTLLKHRDAGDVIEWVIATAAHSPKWSDEIIGIKNCEIEAVAKRYSVSEIHRLGLPSGRLDITPIEALIEGLAEAIEKARCGDGVADAARHPHRRRPGTGGAAGPGGPLGRHRLGLPDQVTRPGCLHKDAQKQK